MLLAKKIALTDTSIAISYLTTRVIYPYKSDWLKMVHMFKYIRSNKDIPLILSIDQSIMLKWYIVG